MTASNLRHLLAGCASWAILALGVHRGKQKTITNPRLTSNKVGIIRWTYALFLYKNKSLFLDKILFLYNNLHFVQDTSSCLDNLFFLCNIET